MHRRLTALFAAGAIATGATLTIPFMTDDEDDGGDGPRPRASAPASPGHSPARVAHESPTPSPAHTCGSVFSCFKHAAHSAIGGIIPGHVPPELDPLRSWVESRARDGRVAVTTTPPNASGAQVVTLSATMGDDVDVTATIDMPDADDWDDGPTTITVHATGPRFRPVTIRTVATAPTDVVAEATAAIEDAVKAAEAATPAPDLPSATASPSADPWSLSPAEASEGDGEPIGEPADLSDSPAPAPSATATPADPTPTPEPTLPG